MVSNASGASPTTTTTRYNSKEKQHITIQQPCSVSMYNKSMGWVDRMDQNIAQYHCSIRGKKWYWPLIAHFIDMMVCQAWQLYHLSASLQLDQLEFW